MNRQKTTDNVKKPRRVSSTIPNHSKSRRQVLLFGICKPGLIIIMVAYILLAIAALIAVISPHIVIGKIVALVAYCLLSGLFIYKGYWVWCVKGNGRRAAEVAGLEVLNGQLPPEPPLENGGSAQDPPR
jgi:hypothetical protein